MVMMLPFLCILLSFCLISAAQPDISVVACIFASGVGYAIFWKGLLFFKNKRRRFFLATFWFAGILAVHLSWFTSDRYVGTPIFLVLPLLWLSLGALFGAVSLLLPTDLKGWNIPRMLAICGFATILEWARLFVLCGFSFDPMGLALTGTTASLQFVSLVGMYGLSFWILFTNLMFLRWMVLPRGKSSGLVPLTLAMIPYLYGFAHIAYHEKQMSKEGLPPLSVVLVQTSLAPEEKVSFGALSDYVYTPEEQWQRILALLEPHHTKMIDLIVLSEAVVPYGTEIPIYSIESVSKAFEQFFGATFLKNEEKETRVGNSYWARSLANYFNADVVIGLEECNEKEAYNAAFFFSPDSPDKSRYEKRVLVPMGEYIPFAWCKKILARYGIQDSFTAGEASGVFKGSRVPMGISICYEETFGHLMRENRLQGAKLLVNLTNDVWYPQSRLPVVHYLHGRLRAVEAGIPLVRSCNTGLTCAVDSLGRVVDSLPFEKAGQKCPADSLYAKVPMYTYKTLYTYTGDSLVIGLSACFVLFYSFRRRS